MYQFWWRYSLYFGHNTIIWPKMAIFQVSKVPFVGTLKMYQEMSDIIQSDLIKFDHQSSVKMAEKWPEMGPKWPIWAQNGHFWTFNKVPFVGTLKFCQKIPDIMKSESINLIIKLYPKWPKNGLKWPNRAQNGHFQSFNKVPIVGTLKLYQEVPDILQTDLIKFDNISFAKMTK